jgi:hypothetical protein
MKLLIRRLCAVARLCTSFPSPSPCGAEQLRGRRRTIGKLPLCGIGLPAMPHFVYLLRNKHGRQYVGQTTNLNARLFEHNEGFVMSTKNLRSWEWSGIVVFKTEPQQSSLRGISNQDPEHQFVTGTSLRSDALMAGRTSCNKTEMWDHPLRRAVFSLNRGKMFRWFGL